MRIPRAANCAVVATVALASILIAAGLRAASGLSGFVVKGWKIEVEDDDKKVAVKLFGEQAQDDEEGLWHVTTLRMEAYEPLPDGSIRTNLIIKAPSCVWNGEAETVRSSAEIEAWTPDGKFRTRGRGFLWSRATELLIMTNGAYTSLAPPENAGAAESKDAPRNIEITSVELHLMLTGDKRFARYRSVVDVVDPTGVNLKCYELQVDFDQESKDGNAISEVKADGSVEIVGQMEGREFEAHGPKAVYRVSPRGIELPDGPVIKSGPNLLTGRHATIDIADTENLILAVDGNVRMEAVETAQSEAGANGSGTKASAGHAVVHAGSLRFEEKDGLARFADRVKVESNDGVTLSAMEMDVKVDADTGAVGLIEARKNVLVELTAEQGPVTAKADSATIHKSEGLVVLRRKGGAQPEILQGPNLVRGDEIELDARNREDIRFKAKGDTRLKAVDLGDDQKSPVELRADRFSYGGKILLAEGGAEVKFVTPESENSSARSMTARAQSVIVDQKLGTVTLDTRVHIQDDQGMDVTCDHLITDLPDPKDKSGRLANMTARGNVAVSMMHEGRTFRAFGDKAVYAADRDELELTGNSRILADETRVFGDRILANIAVAGERNLRAVGHARFEGETETKDGKRRYKATSREMVVDEKAGKARLLREVRIVDDAGLDIRCERLDADLPAAGAKVAVAKDGSSVSGIPNFIARERVVARLEHEQGVGDVQCDEAEYFADTDTLELRGNIVGATPEGKILGSVMRYSLKTRRGIGSGRLVIDVQKAMKKRDEAKKKK